MELSKVRVMWHQIKKLADTCRQLKESGVPDYCRDAEDQESGHWSGTLGEMEGFLGREPV